MTQVIDYMEAGVGIEPASTALQAACEAPQKSQVKPLSLSHLPAFLGWFFVLFALYIPSAQALTYLVMGQSNLTRDDGVEAGFKSRMAELSNEPVDFIECAYPDTRIAQFARSWVRTTIYADCLAAIGNTPISGVIWWQGENDAMQQTWASSWAREFVGVISGLRQDLGYSVPIGVAVLHGGPQSSITPFWSTVRALQGNLEAPGLVRVSTEGVTYPDRIHADYSGHFEIGKRFAEALK